MMHYYKTKAISARGLIIAIYKRLKGLKPCLACYPLTDIFCIFRDDENSPKLLTFRAIFSKSFPFHNNPITDIDRSGPCLSNGVFYYFSHSNASVFFRKTISILLP